MIRALFLAAGLAHAWDAKLIWLPSTPGVTPDGQVLAAPIQGYKAHYYPVGELNQWRSVPLLVPAARPDGQLESIIYDRTDGKCYVFWLSCIDGLGEEWPSARAIQRCVGDNPSTTTLTQPPRPTTTSTTTRTTTCTTTTRLAASTTTQTLPPTTTTFLTTTSTTRPSSTTTISTTSTSSSTTSTTICGWKVAGQRCTAHRQCRSCQCRRATPTARRRCL